VASWGRSEAKRDTVRSRTGTCRTHIAESNKATDHRRCQTRPKPPIHLSQLPRYSAGTVIARLALVLYYSPPLCRLLPSIPRQSISPAILISPTQHLSLSHVPSPDALLTTTTSVALSHGRHRSPPAPVQSGPTPAPSLKGGS
jgi:hypothetical protein